MRRNRRLLLAAGALSASVAGCPAFLRDEFRVDIHAGSDASNDASLAEDVIDVSVGDVVDGSVDDGIDASSGDVVDAAEAVGDASVPNDARPDETMAADEGQEAAASCCSTTLSDPLDLSTWDHWLALGSARALPDFVELTPDQRYSGGGVFWRQPASSKDFDLKFDFSITKATEGGVPLAADGLAVVAVASLDGGTCASGAALCVLGSTVGLGVVVRTYSYGGKEPPAPYVAVFDVSRSLGDPAGPSLVDGAVARVGAGVVRFVPPDDAAPPAASWQTVCLRVSAGKASVKLGGQMLFSNVDWAGPAPFYWGFVGGTGSFSERNAVRQVSVSFPGACAGPQCADAGPCGTP